MKISLSTKFILIITLCTTWVIFIPGLVAYKNDVFFGTMFMNKIPDSVIVSRIQRSELALKHYKDDKVEKRKKATISTVTFSGFADHGLNYVWLESYILLCVYAFILYYSFPKKLVTKETIVLTVFVFFLFHLPTWIRNSGEFGKYGRTIYSFVNYDIDKASFWLQEFRGYVFSFLIAVFWYQFELRRQDSLKVIKQSIRNFNVTSIQRLATHTKIYFNNWQRDILLSVVLFLPWTWFYWRNIYYHGDTRYVFPAIIFHSFWIISIILISRPFVAINFSYWNLRNRLTLKLLEDKGNNERIIAYLENVDPLPKGQFFLTSLTAFISLISPFIQIVLKM